MLFKKIKEKKVLTTKKEKRVDDKNLTGTSRILDKNNSGKERT